RASSSDSLRCPPEASVINRRPYLAFSNRTNLRPIRPGVGYPRRMAKPGRRSISPAVLIGGVVVLLAVTLAFAVPAFMGGPPRRAGHVVATPVATPITA